MREHIDGADFRDMLLCASEALSQNKQLINELNVFPVPDGDTGTNMSLTIGAAATELTRSKANAVGEVAEVAASAMLRGARGNSGVILSLLFRGISKFLRGSDTTDAEGLAMAMEAGVDAAYKAVMKPAEGTILTVSRAATRTAREFSEENSDIELMFEETLATARVALEHTIEQNPVLKKAGVIDAGGKGYVILLDAMLASLQGRALPVESSTRSPAIDALNRADFLSFEDGDITYTYCTEFIVERTSSLSTDELRNFLNPRGDSIVVVDDEEVIKVHIHTDDPGLVLTEALRYGSFLSVKIENMRQQHTEMGLLQELQEDPGTVSPFKKYGIVSVVSGQGLTSLFRELGADGIVTGGQTMNPSTEDILSEINRTPAEIVYILPNNRNIIMAAEQCVPLTDKQVLVIPTTTVPEGIAAMLSLDTALPETQCTEALTVAMEGVHTALITYAARDSDFDGRSIREGEYLALLNGALIGNFKDKSELAQALCSAFEPFEPEFISVYYGEDVDAESAEEFAESLAVKLPDAEINLIDGGQPVYYYMISCE